MAHASSIDHRKQIYKNVCLFYNWKKIVSTFLQIFQLMLGQKFEITLVATFIDFKNFTSWTSVFHYLDPSLPLLKSRHEKLRAHVLVNLFSMVLPTLPHPLPFSLSMFGHSSTLLSKTGVHKFET